jgi:hypothetical protein
MATPASSRAGEPTLDPTALYREEIYTDRMAGTLRVMLPVTSDGAPDASRPTLYTGEAQILTNMGPVPIGFDIEARTLAEAVANYAAAAKEGIERTMRELQEMRRQASSSIVIPQGGAGGLGGGGLGGGKIQLP